MFAALSSKRRAHLRHALLAAYRRGLPDTRDTSYGLGVVIRPTWEPHGDAVRPDRSQASSAAATRSHAA